MRRKTIILFSTILIFTISPAFALKGFLATQKQLKEMRKDLLEGGVQVDVTRAKDFLSQYGDPTSFLDSEKKLSFDYSSLVVDFSKARYLRKWEYDSFKKPAYSDDIDSLRFDLESGQIVGDWVSLEKIRKDYGEPTEIYATNDDGDISIYYYGDIKLSFENYFVVKTWEGFKIQREPKPDLLKSK